MIVLDGQPALSRFRLDRLNARLAALAPGVHATGACWVYLVEPQAGATPDQRRLAEILQAGAARGEPGAWVVPRLGTISPWSSKATEILRGCGLAVARVERGVRYSVAGLDGDPDRRSRALRELHDPMTQSVVTEALAAHALFEFGEPAPLAHVVLGAESLRALHAANRSLGLALSDDEIEYLAASYAQLGRDPTDAELMMFAQANSEHCRHKVFNASWRVDGVAQPHSLFAMIKRTHAKTPQHTLSAYSDNAAVVAGSAAGRLHSEPADRRWRAVAEDAPFAIKVETHNHPTAISPFPGASTGSGGEIRDEGATGRGGKPKAGLTGFTVSHLRVPGLARPWESARELPPRLASAFEIMRDGPLGAAAFNNEFGRPALLGYFRSFECATADPALVRGYDKPIMLAGGIANLRPGDVAKRPLKPGDAVIVLGGPAMLIGLGGGAASSVGGGDSTEALDFASVQRDNPEMQRRCQEVIDRCAALGDANPVVSIHDVGAGGLSNAIPELLNDSHLGGEIDLRRIPCDDPHLSPMQIWCNESQERYVLGVPAARVAEFEALCARERCPVAVVGHATAERRLVVSDPRLGGRPVDLPLEVLFGKPPRMHRDAVRRDSDVAAPFAVAGIDLADAVERVLRHPSVASKSYLVTIGDRTVGGLCARDQMVGPWQVPVADCAATLLDFDGLAGEAMAIGERTPLALLSAPAAARMAVGEALTNLLAAPVQALDEVKLSANWMAAVAHPGEDAALFDAVQAIGLELCPALDLAIPVGKDSLSMQAAWRGAGGERRVVSPVSPVVSAFARIARADRVLTPQLRDDVGDTRLLLVDLGGGANRLGGSILAQVHGAMGDAPPDVDDPARLRGFFAAMRACHERELLLAYHDRSDGGALVALAEMAFAGHCGIEVLLDGWADDAVPALFAEELGAVLQVRTTDVPGVRALFAGHGLGPSVHAVGRPSFPGTVGAASAATGAAAGSICFAAEAAPTVPSTLVLRHHGRVVAQWPLHELFALWHETTHAMQRLRDDPECADQERDAACDPHAPGLRPDLTFDPSEDIAAPWVQRGARPRVAILREQGVNGQVEMAAAFTRAGFDAYDVHMTDLIESRDRLDAYAGVVACGGFSYGDVLGAGRGWATSIRHRPQLADQFARFFADASRFALGVCNGCQAFAALKAIVPGASHWPALERNRSEQYEARLALVEVLESPSLFLRGMAGSRIPVAVAHGEGRAVFASASDRAVVAACLRFVDGHGRPADRYPPNPNGSPDGLTGFTNADGRITILMPHPERVFRSVQMSWHPAHWGEDSPWMRMFRNARAWVA
jgi:phosphoribosylformylglycinamidine synthase